MSKELDIITGIMPVDNGQVVVEFNGQPGKSLRAEILWAEENRAYYAKPSKGGRVLGVARFNQGIGETLTRLTSLRNRDRIE